MKQRKLTIIAGLIILATGIGLILWSSNDDAARENAQTQTAPAEVAADLPLTTSSQPTTLATGLYTDYSEQAFADSKGVKVLFFHATWCRQCQMIESDIKIEGVPNGVSIFKVNYDQNTELRKKYGVTLQTTFVKVTNDGQLIQKYVAYEEPTFKSVKENIL